jgi:hypothetical protein
MKIKEPAAAANEELPPSLPPEGGVVAGGEQQEGARLVDEDLPPLPPSPAVPSADDNELGGQEPSGGANESPTGWVVPASESPSLFVRRSAFSSSYPLGPSLPYFPSGGGGGDDYDRPL